MEGFFADCYDYFVERSLVDDLYSTVLCTPTALSTLIVPLIGVVLFYYVINTTRFGKLKHWLLMMIGSGLLVFAVIFLTCIGMQDKRILINPDQPQSLINLRFSQGGSVFFMFALEMFVIACFLFFIYSVCLKWWSSIVDKTPF